LLIGSALLIRTFVALRAVNPGYDTHNVLRMDMSVAGERFQKTANLASILRNGLDRLRALPGVENASATCCPPLEGNYSMQLNIAGRSPGKNPYIGWGYWIQVSSGYFDVFKIPVLKGRVFNDRDDAASAPVVVIDETLAKQFWKDSDPLRDRIEIARNEPP